MNGLRIRAAAGGVVLAACAPLLASGALAQEFEKEGLFVAHTPTMN